MSPKSLTSRTRTLAKHCRWRTAAMLIVGGFLAAAPLGAEELRPLKDIEAAEFGAQLSAEFKALLAKSARIKQILNAAQGAGNCPIERPPVVGVTVTIVEGVLAHDQTVVGALLKRHKPTNPFRLHCSGTLADLNSKWRSVDRARQGIFVTAAHCIATDPDHKADISPAAYKVFLQHAGLFNVRKIHLQRLDLPDVSKDIAILELDRPVSGIVPIRPRVDDKPANIIRAMIAGFGRTGGLATDYGMKRRGNVCLKQCPGNDRDNLCWEFQSSSGPPGVASNTCNGDSGGPVLVTDTRKVTQLAGVISGGSIESCLSGDIATNSSLNANSVWIESVLASASTEQSCKRKYSNIDPDDILAATGEIKLNEKAKRYIFNVIDGLEHIPLNNAFHPFVQRNEARGAICRTRIKEMKTKMDNKEFVDLSSLNTTLAVCWPHIRGNIGNVFSRAKFIRTKSPQLKTARRSMPRGICRDIDDPYRQPKKWTRYLECRALHIKRDLNTVKDQFKTIYDYLTRSESAGYYNDAPDVRQFELKTVRGAIIEAMTSIDGMINKTNDIIEITRNFLRNEPLLSRIEQSEMHVDELSMDPSGLITDDTLHLRSLSSPDRYLVSLAKAYARQINWRPDQVRIAMNAIDDPLKPANFDLRIVPPDGSKHERACPTIANPSQFEYCQIDGPAPGDWTVAFAESTSGTGQFQLTVGSAFHRKDKDAATHGSFCSTTNTVHASRQ